MRPHFARHVALLIAPLAACNGSSYTYDGEPIAEYYPLDGERWWEYRQCASFDSGAPVDTSVYSFYDPTGCNDPEEGILRTEKFPETTSQGSVEVVQLDTYRIDGTGSSTPVYSVKWSSDNSKGIRIYGWTDLTTGAVTTYDPPIQFAEHQMNVGDSVETTTGGASFTTTFHTAKADCPNNWSGMWDECMHLEIVADGVSAPFLGNYFIGASYGLAAFQAADASDVWVLDDACWKSSSDAACGQ